MSDDPRRTHPWPALPKVGHPSPLQLGLEKHAAKFADEQANALPADAPEAHSFILEAALQRGFEMIDDEGDVYVCSSRQIVALVGPYRARIDELQTTSPQPIDMILHCPACGLQHIDADNSDEIRIKAAELGVDREGYRAYSYWLEENEWTNPPHRSHLCAGCGHIWRPADVATNGVLAVKTKGTDDSSPVKPLRPAPIGVQQPADPHRTACAERAMQHPVVLEIMAELAGVIETEEYSMHESEFGAFDGGDWKATRDKLHAEAAGIRAADPEIWPVLEYARQSEHATSALAATVLAAVDGEVTGVLDRRRLAELYNTGWVDKETGSIYKPGEALDKWLVTIRTPTFNPAATCSPTLTQCPRCNNPHHGCDQ